MAPLMTQRYAYHLGFWPFLRPAPSRPLDACIRLMRERSMSVWEGFGFIAVYGTSVTCPPKLPKTHRFLAVCRRAASERSYPRDRSAGRIRFMGGSPGGPRSHNRSRRRAAILGPDKGENRGDRRDIPQFMLRGSGSNSWPAGSLDDARPDPFLSALSGYPPPIDFWQPFR